MFADEGIADQEWQLRSLKLSVEDVAVAAEEVWRPLPLPTLERRCKHPPLAHRVPQRDTAAGRRRPPTLEHLAVQQV